MQICRNDGSCVLKSSLALCMVYDPGVLLLFLCKRYGVSKILFTMHILMFPKVMSWNILVNGWLFALPWVLLDQCGNRRPPVIRGDNHPFCHLGSIEIDFDIKFLNFDHYHDELLHYSGRPDDIINCFLFLLQNDLIHAWGLDKKLGYCAQATFHSRQPHCPWSSLKLKFYYLILIYFLTG